MRAGLLILGVATSLALWVNPAAAKTVQFCNQTSHVLQVALAIASSDNARSFGWDLLMPGSCRRRALTPRRGEQIFVHAASHAAHAGPVLLFDGPESFCVRGGAEDFSINGRRDCDRREALLADFAPVDMDGRRPRVDFLAAENYSRRRARVAGVQRLLRDASGNATRIDGFAGRATMDALNAHRRTVGARTRSRIYEADLISLLTAATQQREERGLDLCNDTPRRIWVAVGQLQDDDFASHGWMQIAPAACVKAINDVLSGRYYFVYGESRLEGAGAAEGGSAGRRIWGGDFSLCVKPTSFMIRGRGRCAARGFVEASFLRLDTGRAQQWEYRFEP